MDKLDEYNFEQIKRIYTEPSSILFLIRIIKEAKIDKGKDKSYIEELEGKIKDLEQTIKDNFDVDKEAIKETKKEEKYKRINETLRNLEKAQQKLKSDNAKYLYELVQLRVFKEHIEKQ